MSSLTNNPRATTWAPELPDAPADYAVRAGFDGSVFRMSSDEVLQRGERVICRTHRGLEVGQILSALQHASSDTSDRSGKVLRRMTGEDHLLWSNLQQLAGEARSECADLLHSHGFNSELLEVEPLFDGRTLYFHFLSDVAPEIEPIMEPLLQRYQKTVADSQFAQLLEHGCGPGCGTEKATRGCGSSGGCVVCKAASGCSSRVARPNASK